MSFAIYGAFLGAGAGIAIGTAVTWGERLSRVLSVIFAAALSGALILGGLSGCLAYQIETPPCPPGQTDVKHDDNPHGLNGCIPNDLLKELK